MVVERSDPYELFDMAGDNVVDRIEVVVVNVFVIVPDGPTSGAMVESISFGSLGIGKGACVVPI